MVPTGTANVLARELGIPLAIGAALLRRQMEPCYFVEAGHDLSHGQATGGPLGRGLLVTRGGREGTLDGSPR